LYDVYIKGIFVFEKDEEESIFDGY